MPAQSERFGFRPTAKDCQVGWSPILEKLRRAIGSGRRVVCVECYPGVREEAEQAVIQGLSCSSVIATRSLLKSAREIDAMLAPYLGDDPVFGRMNAITLEDFFDPTKLAAARECAQRHDGGVLLVIGTGAALVAPQADVLVYSDLARWEIQLRQRRGEIGNLGADNLSESPSLKHTENDGRWNYG